MWWLASEMAALVGWTAAGVAIFAVVLVVGGGYLAATYQQHSSAHSGVPLANATPPPLTPVDTTLPGGFPCQGDEITAYALNTLRLEPTAKGFRSTTSDPQLAEPTAPTPPAPDAGPDADAAYQAALATWNPTATAWKQRMEAVIGDAENKMKTKCDDIAKANKEASPAPAPALEGFAPIVGTYTVDNMTVNAIGGCGDSGAQAKAAPTKLEVQSGASKPIIIVTIAGGSATTLSGPNFDINGDHIDYTQPVNGGGTASLNGNFYLSSGRWQFNGEYATTFGEGGGCGFQFVAVGDKPASSGGSP